MRDQATTPSDGPLLDRVLARGRAAGLEPIGVCDAEPFLDTRRVLEERRAAGLHGGMNFTYRNPVRSTDPRAALPSARSIVVAGLAYGPSAGVGDPDGLAPGDDGPGDDGAEPPRGRVARYAAVDHYAVLREALGQVADVLRSAGHRGVVLADDNALVDRAVAHRAGLGWFGHNANLLVPGRGSWFVLGSVLTDAALPVATTTVPDGCGTCRRCLDGCPTGAIVAPGVVDAGRCIAWHLQVSGDYPRHHREALGDRIYGCDDCQEVCPPNRRAERDAAARAPGGDVAPAGPEGQGRPPGVDLVWMLDAPDDELLDRLGRWYVPRRDPRYLRRNALVALGNTGRGDHPAVGRALRRHLTGDDDLLAAHATWAARRLGRDDLLADPRVAHRPAVRAELAAIAAAGAAGADPGAVPAAVPREDGAP